MRFVQTDADKESIISMEEFAQHEIKHERKDQGSQAGPGVESRPGTVHENPPHNKDDRQSPQGQGGYSLSQALSNRAQLSTHSI